jgi:hypothetical protein
MEMDDVRSDAGSLVDDPPALNTRLQKRHAIKGKNSHTLLGNQAEIGTKIDFLVKTILNVQRNQENISQQCLDLQRQNETLKDQNEALKRQNDYFQREIESLQDEVKKLQDRVSSLTAPNSPQASQSSPSTGTSSLNRSWSSLFANNSSVSPNSSASQQGKREPNCIRISTPWNPTDANVGNNLTRYLPTNAASNRIKDVLQKDSATQNVRVAGIGVTRRGYLIRFRDKQSAETAYNSTGWLQELGHRIKIDKPRFGVVVHGIPTNEVAFTDDKTESINKIMDENELAIKGFQIEDVAWLKKKEAPLGARASLGIWFNSAQAAEWAINDGMLFGDEYIGSVEAYEVKRKRCYKCQALGHLARDCKETVRCGHCAMEHDQRDCPPGSIPKCVDCNGEHPTGSRECKGINTP